MTTPQRHEPRPAEPGTLLLAPTGSAREQDVLCIFDTDPDEPGALFALLLNRATDRPAQPLAFGLFDCAGANAWWGGPTFENFALVELARPTGPDDRWRPNGLERRFLTARTAVWLPGRDHAPSTPLRVRVFLGSLWLSAGEVARYAEQGLALPASDDWLFDPEPSTLAARLRHAVAHGNAEG